MGLGRHVPGTGELFYRHALVGVERPLSRCHQALRTWRPGAKAKAEVGVQIVERWILALLRNHTFFSLIELNQTIQQLVLKLNQRLFKKLPWSRSELFQSLDKSAIKALPITPYVYAEWKLVRVHIDYHVDIEGHYYSVPYRLVKQQLEARITENTIEVFNKGERIAVTCDPS
jgi:transposase